MASSPSTAMHALRDDLPETRMRERERETRRARDDQQALQALRERYERLEEEHVIFRVCMHTAAVSVFCCYESISSRLRGRR
jgi:hypothetical protein